MIGTVLRIRYSVNQVLYENAVYTAYVAHDRISAKDVCVKIFKQPFAGEKEFVEAAHAVGATDRRIIFVHLLPNILGPLMVLETLAIPGYIFTEAFLSFIGLGVQPGTPSWGSMISQVRERGGFFSNRHVLLVPSIALVLTALSFNFLGDGLRDALDPRLRGTH